MTECLRLILLLLNASFFFTVFHSWSDHYSSIFFGLRSGARWPFFPFPANRSAVLPISHNLIGRHSRKTGGQVKVAFLFRALQSLSGFHWAWVCLKWIYWIFRDDGSFFLGCYQVWSRVGTGVYRISLIFHRFWWVVDASGGNVCALRWVQPRGVEV